MNWLFCTDWWVALQSS